LGGLLVGALTKKVLDSVVYNKKCGMCKKQFSREGNYQNLKKHQCVKNYNGTLKAIKAQALVEMLERTPKQYNVSICTIISNDDSNGRAKAQHVSKQGQLTKAIEQPSFKADPSDCK
jgi:hypothetical protein